MSNFGNKFSKELKNTLGTIKKSVESNVKTPSGGQNFDELSYKYLTAIGGLLGAVIAGKDGDKVLSNPDNAKSIISKSGKGLFPDIQTITEVINKRNAEFVQTYITNLDRKLSDIVKELQGIAKAPQSSPEEMSLRLLLEAGDSNVVDFVNFISNIDSIEEGVENIQMLGLLFEKFNEQVKDIDIPDEVADNIREMSFLLNGLEDIKLDNTSIQLTEFGNAISTFVDKLQELNNIKIKTIDNKKIKSIVESINEFSGIKLQSADLSQAGDLLKSINSDILGDLEHNDNPLKNFIDNINKLQKTIDIKKAETIKTAAFVMSSFSAFSKDKIDAKIIKEHIKQANEILISKEGLKSLLNTLNEFVDKDITKNLNEAARQLEVVSSFFNAISSITKINPIVAKFNVWFAKHFLIDDINDIIVTLNKVAVRVDPEKSKEVSEGFEIFRSFMSALNSIVDWDKEKRKNAKRNVRYINNFIVDSVAEIMSTLSDSVKVTETEGEKNIDELQAFFKSILLIADIPLSKIIIEIPFKIWIINSLIKDSVNSVIDNLNKLNLNERTEKVIKNLDHIFDFLKELNNTVPGPAKTMWIALKLALLDVLVFSGLDQIVYDVNWLEDELKVSKNEQVLNIVNNTVIPKINEMLNLINKLSIKGTGDILSEFNDDVLVDGLGPILANTWILAKMAKYIPEDELDYVFSVLNKFTNDELGNIVKNLVSKDDMSKVVDIIDTLKIIGEKLPIEIDNVGDIKKTINKVVTVIASSFDKDSKLGKQIQNLVTLKKADVNKIKAITDILKAVSEIPDLKVNRNLEKFIKNDLTILAKNFDEREKKKIGAKLANLIKLDKNTPDKIKLLAKSLEELKEVNKQLALIQKLKINKGVFKVLEAEVASLQDLVNNFASIDSAKMKDAIDALKQLNLIVISSAAILLGGSLVMAYISTTDLLAFSATLALFVWGIMKVFTKTAEGLKDSMDGAKGASLLIAAAGGVLLFGGIVMKIIDPGQLLAFTGCLTILLFGVISAFAFAHKYTADAMEAADEFAKLIAVSAGVLLAGSIIMHFIDGKDVALFITTLFTMVAGIAAIGTIAAMFVQKGNLVEALNSIRNLVLVSGAILALGSLIVHYISWKDILAFILYETVFITALCGVYYLAAEYMNSSNAFEVAHDFVVLVLASAGILLLGSIIVNFLDWSSILLFTIALTGFIWGVTSAYAFNKDGIKDSFKDSMGLMAIVLASGLILMIAASILSPEQIAMAFVFALTIAGFIFAITYAYKFNHEGIKDSLKDSIGLALLILISGAILITAAMLITDPVQLLYMGLFVVVLGGFIWAICAIYGHFGKKFPETFAGALGLALIVAISGIILLAAAMIIDSPEKLLTIFGFAIVLGLFTLGICYIYSKFSKNFAETFMGALGLALIVGISGAVLIVAATLLSPEDIITVGLFATVLLGFVYGMCKVSKILDKNKKSIWSAVGIMGSISAILFVAALAFGKIADIAMLINKSGGLGAFVAVSATIAIVIGGLTALTLVLAASLGNGVTTAAAYLAIGVLLAVAGAIWVVADAFQKTANALNTFATMPKIDGSKLVGNVMAFLAIANAMAPIAGLAPMMIQVSIAVQAMSRALSAIAASVQEYAELKVPIYDGLKKVGYRSLKKSDFQNAANNVGLLISVLGGAIIKTYERNPDMFSTDFFGRENAFTRVVKSVEKLGPMLSSIARAVKNYATMRVPVYEGTKVVGYQQLESKDFESAAANVAHIIMVLGDAIMSAYDKKPEIFETDWLGTSKFSKVVKSVSKLGPMISSIATGVKNYANMTVPTEWEYNPKTGKMDVKKVEQLKDEHFQAAADNVTLIINTLGEAVIKAYEAHPDYYDSGFFKNSPFTKTINANMNLANLITKIAGAVRDYANMQVITYEPKDGKLVPIKSEQLKPSDFEDASKNIQHIISTLGDAIIGAYEAHPDYYEDGLFSGSPFGKTINANIKLANLITKIAGAVRDYANMQVITYKVEKGKIVPESTIRLGKGDFTKAAEHIQLIMSTLGNAIIDTYNANPEMYDSTGFFGGGKSPFEKTVNANIKLANMITSIAKGVQTFASLQVPVYKPGSTEIASYKQLGKPDFDNAATHIETIISTLGKSVIDTYRNHEDWFEDGEDSIFSQACKSITSLANMISGIASGVKAFAELRVPLYEDSKDGTKITGYRELKNTDFTNAADHVKKIVNTLGKSVLEITKENPEWFESGEDSVFASVCNSIATMGSMLSGVAEGIKSYAELNIATEWDKDGNPIAFRALKKEDFGEAASNIKEIISTVGGAIVELASDEKSKEMFDVPSKWDSFWSGNSDNKFVTVVKSTLMLGQVISTIAESVKDYAGMTIPIKWDKEGKPIDFRTLTSQDYQDAKTNIQDIIKTVAQAISDVSKMDLFQKSLVEIMSVMATVNTMGNIISNISEGVKNYANMRIVDEYGADGKPKSFRKFEDADFDAASRNISKIITTLGKAISTAYKENPKVFDSDNVLNIVRSVAIVGKAIAPIAKGVQMYANLTMPVYDKNNNLIEGKRVKIDDKMFNEAGVNIAKTMLAVGKAVLEIANDPIFKDNTKALDRVAQMYKSISGILTPLAKSIIQYASLSFTDPVTKKVVKLEGAALDKAISSIQDILTAVGTAIKETVKDNEDIFGGGAWNKFFGGSKLDDSKIPALVAAKAIGLMADPVVKIAGVLGQFASGNVVEIEYDAKGNMKSSKITPMPNIVTAKKKIKAVLIALGEAIQDVYKGREKLFSKDDNSPAKRVSEGLSGIVKTLVDVTTHLTEFMKVSDSGVNINNIDEVKKNALAIFGADDEQGLRKILSTIFTETNVKNIEEYKKLNNKIVAALKGISATKATYKTSIKDTEEIINSLIDTICNTDEKLKTIANVNIGKDSLLWNTIQNFLNICNKLKEIQGQNEDKGFFDTLKSRIKSDIRGDKDANTLVQEYSASVASIVDIAEYAQNAGEQGYSFIAKGIDKISSSTAKIKDNGKFEQHGKVLNKYVQTVNSLNISKIDRLIKMTTAMTLLANKIGNIDKFTEVLAEEISVVLTKLTKELKTAKETIDKSEKIQKKRHEMIESSIKQVKSIMNDPLKIEISKVDDSTELSGGSSGGSSSTSSGANTSSGGEGGGGGSLSDSGGTVQNNNDKEIVKETTTTPEPQKPASKGKSNTNFTANNDNIERKVNEILETVNKINNKVK